MKNINYKWITIAMCFLMVMVSLGFTSSTRSLFPDEIAKDLGTQRSLVVIGDSCRYIATSVVTVFFGFLVGKIGPKKLICGGFVFLITSMLAYSFADNLAMIYLGGTFLGVGLSFTGTSMVGYIVGTWCSKNKGTIMGAVLASNGIGGAIAIQITGKLIDPNVTGSYRKAYFMIAMVLLATLIILLIFLRDKPKNAIDPVSSNANEKKRGQDWVGIELSEAVKKAYFWGALLCVFFSGTILQGTHGIVKMHLMEVGVDYSRVLSLLSFGSIILASAKFLAGFIYDKMGLRVTASICIFIAIASTFILAVIKGGTVGFILAIVFTVISQFALPLETVMLPIYASDLFGKKSYSKILGIFVSVTTAGFALGSPLLNLSYDLLGSYVPALIIVGSIMLGILVILQFVISAAHKERVKIEAELNKIEVSTVS